MRDNSMDLRIFIPVFFIECKNKIISHIKSDVIIPADDTEALRKYILLNVVCGVGVVALINMGILAFSQSNPYLGGIDFVVAALLSINIFYLHRSGSIEPACYFGIGYALLLFWFLVFSGGVGNTAYVWSYTFPLFAMFLLGAKKGLVANVVFIVPTVLFLIVEPEWKAFTSYPNNLKLRFIPSYLVVLIYAFLFEFIREKYFQRLKQEIVEHQKTTIQLKKAKLVAENSNKAKSDFLAGMSHELRTPLNHILGFTELVADKHLGDLNSDQEEYLNDVLDSGSHLLSLINDILDISKVESGKMTFDPERVELDAILQNSTLMIKEQVHKHDITLATQIDALPKGLFADKRKLKQVLYNLLSNAIKFTPEKGSITISARRYALDNNYLVTSDGRKIDIPDIKQNQSSPTNSWVKVSISDTGSGLAEKDLNRIFIPFEQATKAIYSDAKGTGLGLSLAEQFVRMHGGVIWAESEGKNKGSTFAFILPFKGG